MWRLFFLLLFCPVFGQMTLPEAECIALENNKDVLAMRQLVKASEEGRLISLSRWWPQVEFINRGYKTERRQFITKSKSAFIGQFSATQALISSDRYFDVRISSLMVQQLRRLLDAVMIDVLYQVRSGYYQVVLDHENIATAEEHVELLVDLSGQANTNFRIGTSILLTANQAKVAIANATTTYYDAVKQLKIDLDALAEVLGYTPGCVEIELAEQMIPVGEIPELACKLAKAETVFEKGEIYDFRQESQVMANLFDPGEIACWEGKALRLQPTLRSIQTEVQIATQEVGMAKGKYLPTVLLEANYGGYATRMLDNPSSHLFNEKYNWAVGFVVQWTVFDGFARARGVRKANYAKRAKQYEYKRGVQRTFEEVRKEIFEIEESVANFVSAESNVLLAEETVELADNQFKIGYITIFDYQTVVDGYIQALNTRSQARFDLIRGYYGLRHASGVDLE